MPNWQDFLHFWGWPNSWVLYSCFLTHSNEGRATNADSISWLWAVLIWTQAVKTDLISPCCILRKGRAGSHESSIFSCFWRIYTLFSTVTRLIYILANGVLAVICSSLAVKTREGVSMGPDWSSQCTEGMVTEHPFPVYPASLWVEGTFSHLTLSLAIYFGYALLYKNFSQNIVCKTATLTSLTHKPMLEAGLCLRQVWVERTLLCSTW